MEIPHRAKKLNVYNKETKRVRNRFIATCSVSIKNFSKKDMKTYEKYKIKIILVKDFIRLSEENEGWTPFV